MCTHNICAETILMSTHNICFYGELTKIILQLSSDTLLICSVVTILILMIQSFQMDRAGQTVKTLTRLLQEQTDQGLHCLPFCLYL